MALILPILLENYVSHGNLLMRIGNVRQKKVHFPPILTVNDKRLNEINSLKDFRNN